jgi:hypothetical protein
MITRDHAQRLARNVQLLDEVDKLIAKIVQLTNVGAEVLEDYNTAAQRSMHDLERLGGVKLRTAKRLKYAIVQQVAARLGVNPLDVQLDALERNAGLLKFNETLAAGMRKDLSIIQAAIGTFVARTAEAPPTDHLPPAA